MGILRTDQVSGLGGANAITGSTFFGNSSSNTNAGYLRIETGTTDDFAFGTGDFTIEFWFNRVLSTHQQHFYDFRGTTNTNTLLIYMVNNVMYYFGNGSERITSGTVPSGEWVHFALVRSSASTKMYFNGTQTGSTYSDSINFVGPDKGSGYIGSNGGTDGIIPSGSFLSAHLSNFRVQKGKAEYTAAFTPPTNTLEKTPETVLLTCNSPGDVTNEETGKVVTPSSLNTNSKGPEASRFTPNSPVGFSTTTDVGTQFGTTFDGVTTFDSQAYMVVPGGNTRERNRGRGLHAGGENPSHCNIIDFIQIQSGGNAFDFGDLITVSNSCDGVSSNTRAVFATYDAPTYNSLEFVTMATTGNATDFGDQTISTGQEGTLSNATRGLFAGGYGGAAQVFINTVEFITIPTLGNAQDFGNLREAIVGVGGASDTTRGLFAGGVVPGAYRANIDQFTIATTGDATDFGDLTVARRNPAGTSDSTRGVFFGGNDSGGTNVIDFITIQSAGNATDFGDSTSNQSDASGASDSIRGVFSAGYYGSPNLSNVIEKVIIQSTGNSVDYGDLTDERIQGGSVSDSHGGLS